VPPLHKPKIVDVSTPSVAASLFYTQISVWFSWIYDFKLPLSDPKSFDCVNWRRTWCGLN